MALDLMMSHRNHTNLEENAVREAASGLESVHKLIWLLSQQQEQQQQSSSSNSRSGAGAGGSPSSMDIDLDCKAVADVAVSKFKKVISLLGQTRTGHARFRRAPPPLPPPISVSPVPPQTQENQEVLESNKVYYATPIQQIPPNHPIPSVERNLLDASAKTINFSYSAIGNSSFISSLTGDTDTKQQRPSSSSAFQITNLSQVSSSCGKPPMSSTSSLKRKCSSENLGSGKCGASSSSGRCHCSKKSKRLKLKRVVRVPAISLKMSDIPPDDYSWRKYGQKPIKGSPHPRGYYKCSSVRGCPARKHVERALDDASVQVVTYEGEHNHAISVAETSSLILESS